MTKLGALLHVGHAFGTRDGMLRLSYELQRSTGLMARRMRSVHGWQTWSLERIAPGVRAEDLLNDRRNGKPSFFFHDAPGFADSVTKAAGADARDGLRAEADAILEGKLPFFGRLHHSCGFPPEWFQNPVTGQNVPQQQPWMRLRFASEKYGDLKFVLEPSRFLLAYSLVRAFAVTRDERFAEGFWTAIEDWRAKSPPMSGPLWICGQECSLRIIAWCFGLYGLVNARATTPERVARLSEMIAAHAWRTAQSLNYARSQRSNHLITEAVGLWTAGTLFPELKHARRWQQLGARLLCEAALDQITPEGVSQQHSFNYQRMILHLLIWALRLSEINCVELDPCIRDRAARAYDFLRGVVDPISGRAPNCGSNDGSLIFPLSQCEYEDYRPLLQLGAAMFDRPCLPAGPWDETPLWFGLEGTVSSDSRSTPPPLSSGYCRLGDENSWALIYARRYARRPFQADQLHVDLWWRGLNLARDAGTYLYNGAPPWDNSLSRTPVHNTVTVEGCDQMQRAGRFLWVDWAQASGESRSLSEAGLCDYFAGEHDGYKRLGIIHRRMVRWLREAGWIIVDDLFGAGEHELRLHWLSPDLPFEAGFSPFQARFTLNGGRHICWNLFSSAGGESAIVRAGQSSAPEIAGADLPILGWESPTYSELRPAISLLHRTRAPLPVRFATIVLTNRESRVDRDGEGLTVRSGNRDLARIPLTPGADICAERRDFESAE